jgi:NAD(P)H dehydrogenase (quinone)
VVVPVLDWLFGLGKRSAGMDVLPTYAVYGTGCITAAGVDSAMSTWRSRVERLFQDTPIPYRRQNGGDYPHGHVLADDVVVGRTGLTAHILEERDAPEALVLG